LEARNDLAKAVAQYEKVARTKAWAGTEEAREAERLARELTLPGAIAFYKELYEYKPAEVSLPPGGVGNLNFPLPAGPPPPPRPPPAPRPRRAPRADPAGRPAPPAQPRAEGRGQAAGRLAPSGDLRPGRARVRAAEDRAERPGAQGRCAQGAGPPRRSVL